MNVLLIVWVWLCWKCEWVHISLKKTCSKLLMGFYPRTIYWSIFGPCSLSPKGMPNRHINISYKRIILWHLAFLVTIVPFGVVFKCNYTIIKEWDYKLAGVWSWSWSHEVEESATFWLELESELVKMCVTPTPLCDQILRKK